MAAMQWGAGWKARLVSTVLLDVMTNPLGLEKFGVFLQLLATAGMQGERWCGASHVGDDAELPRGPHRQGSEMDDLSSHRRSGYGCKGFAAEPLLCGFFQPQGVFQPCKGGEGKLNPCLGPCFLLPCCRGPLAKP